MGHKDDIPNDVDSAVDEAAEEFEMEGTKRRRRDDGDVQKTRMQ